MGSDLGVREEDGGWKEGTTWLFAAKFDFLMGADGRCFLHKECLGSVRERGNNKIGDKYSVRCERNGTVGGKD
jgi:hypothetical protein